MGGDMMGGWACFIIGFIIGVIAGIGVYRFILYLFKNKKQSEDEKFILLIDSTLRLVGIIVLAVLLLKIFPFIKPLTSLENNVWLEHPYHFTVAWFSLLLLFVVLLILLVKLLRSE